MIPVHRRKSTSDSDVPLIQNRQATPAPTEPTHTGRFTSRSENRAPPTGQSGDQPRGSPPETPRRRSDPAPSAWSTETVAAATRTRFINATGEPFVTLDDPTVREARCANELLLEAVERESMSPAELFLMSSSSSRETATIGRNLRGEWFTQMRIGERVHLGDDVNLLGHGFIELHDDVQVGDGVTIDTIGHPNDPDLRHTAFTGTVIVQEGVRIGANTVIVAQPGRTLVVGRNAAVSNDSIVVKSVASGATVGGVPAKAVEEIGACTLQRPDFSPQGYRSIDTPETARALFGPAADVKLPVFVKGDGRLRVEGAERIGINRGSMFDLQGDLTIHSPFQMAARAFVQVLPGATAEFGARNFLYTACRVVAKKHLVLGDDAIIGAGASVDRDVGPGSIVVRENHVSGHVTDKTYGAVPDEWKDPRSLQPKVEEFRRYKASQADQSFEGIREYALNAARALNAFRTREFTPESRFLKHEFAHLTSDRPVRNEDSGAAELSSTLAG